MDTIALFPHDRIRNKIVLRYPNRNHRFLAFCYENTNGNIDEIIERSDDMLLVDYAAFIERMKAAYYPNRPSDDQDEFTDFIWTKVLSHENKSENINS